MTIYTIKLEKYDDIILPGLNVPSVRYYATINEVNYVVDFYKDIETGEFKCDVNSVKKLSSEQKNIIIGVIVKQLRIDELRKI